MFGEICSPLFCKARTCPDLLTFLLSLNDIRLWFLVRWREKNVHLGSWKDMNRFHLTESPLMCWPSTHPRLELDPLLKAEILDSLL